ncbi:GntR family transcriptional regulator [Azonexus sp.]|uniref:GntR family transcriptional regulator n=1 Tax=Azonexus sp. TaxID=1872668 RepID=UPI0039E2BE99
MTQELSSSVLLPASAPAARATAPTFSPLYRQIKDFLVDCLARGEWGPGAAIPSEAELAQRFNVSQGTVRKAIDEMAAENLLVRRQGKGTFVATHDDPRSHYRFLRLLPDDGKAVESHSEPFSCTVLPATAEIAAALQLPAEAPVILIKRLLSFAGKKVIFDQIHLPAEQFSGLSLESLRASERSLYSQLEADFGVRMIHAEERLRAVAADAESAHWLGVAEASPLLLVERTAYSYGNQPVEWRRGLYLTAQHYYQNNLG